MISFILFRLWSRNNTADRVGLKPLIVKSQEKREEEIMRELMIIEKRREKRTKKNHSTNGDARFFLLFLDFFFFFLHFLPYIFLFLCIRGSENKTIKLL